MCEMSAVFFGERKKTKETQTLFIQLTGYALRIYHVDCRYVLNNKKQRKNYGWGTNNISFCVV